jgi:hypothetical protein
MKVVLEIQEDKADAFMEVIESIPFIIVKRKLTKKERFLKELEEAVEELNQIKAGKKKGQDAREFLKEL